MIPLSLSRTEYVVYTCVHATLPYPSHPSSSPIHHMHPIPVRSSLRDSSLPATYIPTLLYSTPVHRLHLDHGSNSIPPPTSTSCAAAGIALTGGGNGALKGIPIPLSKLPPTPAPAPEPLLNPPEPFVNPLENALGAACCCCCCCCSGAVLSVEVVESHGFWNLIVSGDY